MIYGIKRDKYDDMFSLYIRCRDKFTCTKCGKRFKPPKKLEKLNKKLYNKCNSDAYGNSKGLHCSHFWGRRNKSVRYCEVNADSHCFACHNYFGENPHEFVEWKKEKIGEENFNFLQNAKNQVCQWRKGKANGKKWDQRDEEIFEYYKDKIKSI